MIKATVMKTAKMKQRTKSIQCSTKNRMSRIFGEECLGFPRIQQRLWAGGIFSNLLTLVLTDDNLAEQKMTKINFDYSKQRR